MPASGAFDKINAVQDLSEIIFVDDPNQTYDSESDIENEELDLENVFVVEN